MQPPPHPPTHRQPRLVLLQPQILLPPSAGASLMAQDAFKNGPMFFRLTNAAGNHTHAGLLEFSAAEGFVALPRKARPTAAP